MGAYILRRLLLMIPTIVGIMGISLSGHPVCPWRADRTGDLGTHRPGQFRQQNGYQAVVIFKASRWATMISRPNTAAHRDLIRNLLQSLKNNSASTNRRPNGFLLMMWNYIRFDFGESYFRDVSVLDLIIEKMPVSISLGIWILLISYIISVPLGIKKAVSDGSRFDIWTSGVIIIAYAVPGFLFGIMLIVMFAGGSFFDWFPLRGPGLRQFCRPVLVGENSGLFLAPDAAADLACTGRLCDNHLADQEFLH